MTMLTMDRRPEQPQPARVDLWTVLACEADRKNYSGRQPGLRAQVATNDGAWMYGVRQVS